MTQALVLDFGGVVSRTLFETHALTEAALGLPAGTLRWRGPFDPDSDLLWQDQQAERLSERDYWLARTREVGRLVGEDWDRMETFVQRARGAEVAMLYYSGHATQAQGQNWLIPIGAQIQAESGYEIDAVSAQSAMAQISAARAKVGILILDACRDNPLAINKGGTKGLGLMPSGEGTLVAFATAPGDTAADNGLYARVLSEHLLKPGVELVDVFRNASADVKRATGGKQIPRVGEVALTDRVYLAGPPLATQPVANPVVRNSILDEESFETAADGVTLLREALAKEKSLAGIEAMANRHDPQATYLVGVAKLVGMETPLDLPGARQYLKRAVDLQFRRAFFAYGSMLYDGQGGPENKKEGLQLWEASAVQRFTPSMMRLGRHYAFDAPVAERKPDKARELFKRAAVDTPDANAMLAAMALEGVGQPVDLKSGMALLEEASAKGSALANLRMARFHRWAINVPKNLNLAMSYYAKAIALKSVDAMTDSGRMLLDGDEVPQDVQEGIKRLRQAEALFSPLADSLLAKAYLSDPGRMPAGWPIRAKAVSAAQAGHVDGLLRLVSAYREGSTGLTQNWSEASALAKVGLDLIANSSQDSEAAWPMNAYALGRTRIRAADEGKVPTPAAELADLKRAWGSTAVLKRFTAPVQCAGRQVPFEIYVWDATSKFSPTDAQFDWLKAARGCSTAKDVVESFQKLYRIAHDNNVSFAELSVYAMGKANQPGNKPTTAAASRPAAGSAPAGRSGRTLEAAGLAAVIQEVGKFERTKVKAAEKLQPGLPAEGALDRWLDAITVTSAQTDAAKDPCAGAVVLGQERSKKAGEAAEVIRLDLFCASTTNAYVLLPDDPQREVTLFVRTRKANDTPGSDFGTRYVISRAEGVLRSWHDIDGDGKPDSFGFHLGGTAEPTKTLALSASAL